MIATVALVFHIFSYYWHECEKTIGATYIPSI